MRMKSLVLQIIYSFFVRWFLKIVVGVKFDRAAFLAKEKKFIIVANHNSHLDTMSIMAALPRQIVSRVKPVAAQDYFGRTKMSEMLSNFFINTLLIPRRRDRENPQNDPIEKMIGALDAGFSLILFPEGTRGEPEKREALKPGIAWVLAQRPDIPYIPVFMSGMGRAMPKDDNLIIPFRASLVFGKPTKIKSTDLNTTLSQIEADLKNLSESLSARDDS